MIERETAAVAAVAAVAATAPVAAVAPSASMSAAEVTQLVSLMQGMLDRVERNILDRLDDNARTDAERWRRHDEEFAASLKRTSDRFERVEASIVKTTLSLEALLSREHDDDVRMDARIRPLRGSLAWLWASRRDLVIVGIGLGVLATFLADILGPIFGVHP